MLLLYKSDLMLFSLAAVIKEKARSNIAIVSIVMAHSQGLAWRTNRSLIIFLFDEKGMLFNNEILS